MKLLLTILLVLPLFMLPALTSCGHALSSNGPEFKAAIIDQLADYYPNQALTSQVTQILESHGFTVDVWQGDEVTPSLYAKLPKYGYKLILFRAHLGIPCLVAGSEIIPMKKTSLFSGETYSTTKYITDQLGDIVTEAQMTQDLPTVFAVNSKFITDTMKGRFDGTVILMMGCISYYLDDMAEAFIQKGASAYVGWSGTVTLDYLDRAVIELMDNLFIRQLNIETATTQTMAEIGPDPYYGSRLKYYPADGRETITALIK